MNRYKLHKSRPPFFLPIKPDQVWHKIDMNDNILPDKIFIISKRDMDSWNVGKDGDIYTWWSEDEIWSKFRHE